METWEEILKLLGRTPIPVASKISVNITKPKFLNQLILDMERDGNCERKIIQIMFIT
jgi:hypothetical protein